MDAEPVSRIGTEQAGTQRAGTQQVRTGYTPVGAGRTAPANRRWWDAEAEAYLAEHGDFLGADDFVWCPEGLREQDARLLGDVAGLVVLEVGAGAAQCSRWLAAHGARAIALDLSIGMLREGRRLDLRDGGPGRRTPLLQADATALPLATASVDLACSAYGAVPFVEDSAALMAEVARVLRPGGRWVFATTHAVRWAFPDDPGEAGLTAARPYFDRTPYVEAAGGRLLYAEHHRTLGDRVREIVAAGLVLTDLVEPEWSADNTQVWGGWSPLRGRLLPGTSIYCCRRPG